MFALTANIQNKNKNSLKVVVRHRRMHLGHKIKIKMNLNNPLEEWEGRSTFAGLKLVLTFAAVGLVSILFMLFFVPSIQGKSQAQIDANKLISLTNLERVERRLPSLTVNSYLSLAAERKAEDILKKDYFSHNSPDGKKFSEWVKETDYQYTIVGENLAAGFTSNEAVIKAWMDSEKHKDNILHPKYKDIGIAVLKGTLDGAPTYVIVQYFGATENKMLSENLIPYQSPNLNLNYNYIHV